MLKAPSPIAVLGSYKPDHSHSMDGYAELLIRNLLEHGYNVSSLAAPSILGRYQQGRGAGKIVTTLREVDRFVLAPMAWRFLQFNLLHIADHANAFYLHLLKIRHSILTVHDIVPMLMANGRLSGPAVSLKRKGLVLRFSLSDWGNRYIELYGRFL